MTIVLKGRRRQKGAQQNGSATPAIAPRSQVPRQWRGVGDPHRQAASHAMPMFPLRIRFVDADHAYERFHSFPPADVDYIEGWSRKRDGDSQMILLHLV